jgi:hypothetical protein
MVKANKPIKMRVFLGFFFLLVIASSISKEKKDHPKTIVEANHSLVHKKNWRAMMLRTSRKENLLFSF